VKRVESEIYSGKLVTEFHIHPNGRDQNRNCNTNTFKTGRMSIAEGELRSSESLEVDRNSPKATGNFKHTRRGRE
jgi:hypothetical protein